MEKFSLAPLEVLKVALVAPAGKVNGERLALGEGVLVAEGIDCERMPAILAEKDFLAGSDEMRLKDLQESWCDEAFDIIWAVRGGYGSMRYLDDLNTCELKKYPKVLVGHSDITALHLFFYKEGIQRTVSGIMPAVEFCDDWRDPLTVTSLVKSIRGEAFSYSDQSHFKMLKEGTTYGRILPLTLSVMTYLLHTNHIPKFDDVLLILEDVNEAPYKIDCMLFQLKTAGILQRIKGLVFGDFKGCGEENDLRKIFNEYAAEVEGPVVMGVPFGHCLPRLNLPVGSKAKMAVSRDNFILDIEACFQS